MGVKPPHLKGGLGLAAGYDFKALAGYDFNALSCEASHSSPQFPCFTIENFLLLTYLLNRVAKIADLLLYTGNWHHWHWIIYAFFLRGKIVFIFLPLLLANCLTSWALSNLKSCTNIHWHRQLTLTIFGTLLLNK